MKTKACIIVATLVLAGCSNPQQEQKLQALNNEDSVLLAGAQKKDSAIASYIHSLNEIQDNLDSIKHREKILSSKTEGRSATAQAIGDIKSLDKLILKDHNAIAVLEGKLRKMDVRNIGLERMTKHLTVELAERDSDIVTMQNKLAQANSSIQTITTQFNDSMASMNVQRAVNNSLTNKMNTVYYAVGTMKELKDKGVINKQGGIIGIGSTPKLKQNFNSKYFTRADLTKLSYIPLYSKFSKVITDQPANAFTVKGAKSDSLLITDANAFWSESKYLVVVVK